MNLSSANQVLLTTAVTVVGLISATAGLAQEATPGKAAPAATELVQQLADGSFAERQRATRELLQLGMSAEGALQAATTQGPVEVRERAGLLLNQIHGTEFQRRLAALSASPAAEQAAVLPEWDRFSALVGSDPGSSALFAELQQAERRLFQLRLFAPQQLPAALEQRCSELAREFHGRSEEAFPAASYAAILLLASNPETRLLRATSANVSAALGDQRLVTLLQDGVHKDVLRQLLNAWIERPGIAAERPLLFAMQHQLSAGRTLARRVIASRSSRPDMLMAILALGTLGDASDIPRLEQLFSVTTVLWPMRGRPLNRLLPDGLQHSSDYSVQTCDAALTICVHLRGLPPADFGITVRPSDMTLYVVDSLGFETQAARDAAFAAYRARVQLSP